MNTDTSPVLPGATLGVLGGGQLGRMFVLAARRLGYRTVVFAPEQDPPAGQAADRTVRAPYADLDAVERFAREVDVVTFEFENVPVTAVRAAERHAPVRPSRALLHATQDRLREKRALSSLGLPVAPFAPVREESDLRPALLATRAPAVLKTSGSGYDGHGQRRVGTDEGLAAAWDELDRAPCVLEALVDFRDELSVVGARGLDGEVALYEPFMNRHANHVLDVTLSPAPVPGVVRDAAHEMTRAVLEAFDVVGVLCVEFFLLHDDSLVVNEVAPRPHNSGHVTIDAHRCDQFEQQVRAVCGLPLGSTRQVVRHAATANLLGDLWEDGTPDWPALLADPDVALHLYGKSAARPGRKMGHLTVTGRTIDDAERRARAARAVLREGVARSASSTGRLSAVSARSAR